MEKIKPFPFPILFGIIFFLVGAVSAFLPFTDTAFWYSPNHRPEKTQIDIIHNSLHLVAMLLILATQFLHGGRPKVTGLKISHSQIFGSVGIFFAGLGLLFFYVHGLYPPLNLGWSAISVLLSVLTFCGCFMKTRQANAFILRFSAKP